MMSTRTAICVLIVLLVLSGLWYAGWVFGKRAAQDGEVMLPSSSQVAYCVAGKMTSGEKRVVAQSFIRPPDPALIGRLMPIILSGTLSEEKRAAGRAIEERDHLRSRMKEIVSRIDRCGFNASSGEEISLV